MDKKLRNKICVITGGAGLIGSALVKACAENDATVIIAETDTPSANKLAKNIIKRTGNGKVFVEQCDIADESGVVNKIRDIANTYGSIDILINNAYPKNKNYGKKFEDVFYSDFRENVITHLGGYFLVTQEAAKIMMARKNGCIIFMGSIYGLAAPKFEIYKGTAMTSPVEYAAVKGAVINLMKYLAAYLGPYGIRVNAISPGGVFDNQPESFVNNYLKAVRLGPPRMATPDDIARAALFLISDQAEYITGHNLVIDGGWTI